MQSKDLRIRNFIHDDADYFHQITSINDIELGLVGDSIEFRYAKPIQLTEEWLLKFGFKHLLNHYIELGGIDKRLELLQIGNEWYPTITQDHEMEENTNIISLNYIKYVHELQNLYFALTGEELELKSETKV